MLVSLWPAGAASAQNFPPVAVEGQPLAANINRVLQALDFLGAPLPADTTQQLKTAIKDQDATKLQQVLDKHVLAVVSLSPEARVKAARGPAYAVLQQSGHIPYVLKIVNESTVTKQLNINSPQAGPHAQCDRALGAGGSGTPEREKSEECRHQGRFFHFGPRR